MQNIDERNQQISFHNVWTGFYCCSEGAGRLTAVRRSSLHGKMSELHLDFFYPVVLHCLKYVQCSLNVLEFTIQLKLFLVLVRMHFHVSPLLSPSIKRALGFLTVLYLFVFFSFVSSWPRKRTLSEGNTGITCPVLCRTRMAQVTPFPPPLTRHLHPRPSSLIWRPVTLEEKHRPGHMLRQRNSETWYPLYLCVSACVCRL